MIIVFPMAGLSSRFIKSGYNVPKYMLNVDDSSVFFHSVNSFKNYFSDCTFLFIYRDIQDTKKFIDSECSKMNISSYNLVKLDEPTEGQAHTVYLGLEEAKIKDDEDLLIFNIDTFRPDFKLPSELDFNTLDGYLEVFETEGENWSFVLPENKQSNRVIKTTEKDRISSLCSSGLYYFKCTIDFKNIFKKVFSKKDKSKNEYYIAPMYNYMISDKKDVRFSKISLNKVIFCGTPEEYEKLK